MLLVEKTPTTASTAGELGTPTTAQNGIKNTNNGINVMTLDSKK
jgi:hypothetical protein